MTQPNSSGKQKSMNQITPISIVERIAKIRPAKIGQVLSNSTYKKTLLVFALFALCAAGGPKLFAQAGNDNPTGNAGDFNGVVTTGCSYDPYTGNSKRSIIELSVNGSVGKYPLAFARISNSRYSIGQDDNGNGQLADFGNAGAWLHSYQWTINPRVVATGGHPTAFTANYPDGRIVTFSASTNGDPYYRGPQGVRDRLQVFWDSRTAGRAYLIMPDGGKVWFSIAITTLQGCGSGCTGYAYTLQGIIDPYGQVTTISGSPANFYPNSTGLVTITEPGGRWLKLNYQQVTNNPWAYIITSVTASDGRSIQYGYTWDQYLVDPSLTQVTYFNDSTLVASYTYQADNTGNSGTKYLLSTAIDPMYAGPMWKIGYKYATGLNPDGTAVVYGQILSENYWNGVGNIGAAVSTLTITSKTVRTETRGDGKTRTFTYSTTPLLTNWTDFKGVSSSRAYDSNGYVNSVTDRNGHTTNLTNNAFTGGVLTATFPSTPEDTPPNTPRGVVSYTYGSSSCADPNNKDSNNPYYVCTATDEGGHVTSYLRDTNKRVTLINYPDGGSESFQYNSFAQVTSHTMTTGGVETSSYDSSGLLQTYRDPYHASGNPTALYQYDFLDRVSGVTDALGSGTGDVNHTTSYSYNSRGQVLVTTLPVDPVDGQRHTIQNAYNSNGTLASVTDQLGHVTSYVYDDYRRVRSLTTPGHNTPVTAYSYYDANGTGDDYTYTDGNVTHAVSPSGEKITTKYDENRGRTSVTVADGTSDAATISYSYDSVGNLTSVIAPKEQAGQPFAGQSTITAYDERNRLYSVTDPLGNVTSCAYDAAGRKARVTRANGQVTTFDSFDAMNRLLQQTVKQTPDPDAVTKYAYYTSGLLHTMQDPRLVANNSSYNYSYSYDQMGRKVSMTYPPDSSNIQRTESWHYDVVGRIDTFTNRAGIVKTTVYDALNRSTSVSWNDAGVTPTVTLGYDIASRVTSVTNANAAIVRTYFNDNLLNTETTTYADNIARRVSYTYDADSNRATIQYPNNVYSFSYDYTRRNQLAHVLNNNAAVATYVYDSDGNLTTRTPENGTTSSYTYDALDRATHITNTFNGDSRTLDYAYDSVNNRKWAKRDGGMGDVFGYDLNDQVTSILLNITNPDTASPGNQTINYDANGNRTTFSAYGPTDTYFTNNLNQYTSRNSSSAIYNANGDMTTGLDGSTYTYDSQNRLLTATKAGSTETFNYDGLNRQVSRKIGSASPLYNVYDAWNLIGEYQPSATTPLNAYVYGTGGLIKDMTASSSAYYYQDASGSTSHLADNTGHLVEWYRYDLQGAPTFYNAANSQLPSSSWGVRHLFTGQQWYSDIGLYDLRNRFYSPDMGRFLQADPIGFEGDASNLYRYCGNNPITRSDPTGLSSLYWLVWIVFVIFTVSKMLEFLQPAGTTTPSPSPGPSPSPSPSPPDDEMPPPGSQPLYEGLPPPGEEGPAYQMSYLYSTSSSGGLSGVPFGVSPGMFSMGTWIPAGSPIGYSYGSMGYTLVGVPGTFVTTDSGQTYSTAAGPPMDMTDYSGGSSVAREMPEGEMPEQLRDKRIAAAQAYAAAHPQPTRYPTGWRLVGPHGLELAFTEAFGGAMNWGAHGSGSSTAVWVPTGWTTNPALAVPMPSSIGPPSGFGPSH
jgi:RHS repeat-associated protein